MMAETTLSLSLAAVDIVSEMLRTDVRQYPFQIPGIGERLEDRVRISGAVLTDLQKRGLIRNGAFVPDVERGFRLLSRYQVAIAVMGTVAKDQKIYARACTDGRDAVLATKQGQTMTFDFFAPEYLVHRTVRLLPELHPGPGQSVTISQTPAVRPQDEQGGFFSQVHAPRSNAEAQLRGAEVMMQRPRTGMGQFVITVRRRDSRETEAPGLSWMDTDAGRYLIQLRRGQDGQNWGTFAPADNQRLIHHIGELIQAARQGS
jgi:hypothetical protein